MKICRQCGYKGKDFMKGFLICNKCVEEQNKDSKPSILKDKKFQIIKGIVYSKPENFEKEIGFCYFERDIKSAIEYFKEIVRQQDLSLRKDIFDAINMVFKDVVE